jgi:hypothetical protein
VLDHPLSRPFEPAAPLFLLFLQQIISDRLRKLAETLAAGRDDQKNSEKTAAARENGERRMPACDRHRQQHRINSNPNARWYHIYPKLSSKKMRIT